MEATQNQQQPPPYAGQSQTQTQPAPNTAQKGAQGIPASNPNYSGAQSSNMAAGPSMPVPVHAGQSGGGPQMVEAQAKPVMYVPVYQSQLYGRCAVGEHQPTTTYGPCGIITAIFCFPIGFLCLFADREKSCIRCGQRLQ